jgi:uncharacterized repeat protein (TIGR01451 family)/CSLREA domain-containing protein
MSEYIRNTRVVIAVLAAIVLPSFQFGVLTAHAGSVFTVNSVADGGDASPGDGLCDDGGGQCTLRAAIEEANATAGSDEIDFDLAGIGVHTIAPASPLPQITDTLTIDGTTQSGFSGTPVIELDGTGSGGFVGLDIAAPDTVVRGLVIDRFPFVGMAVEFTTGVVIEGDFIGTDPTGTLDEGNGDSGIRVIGGADNTIGGTAPGAGNVISGNGAYGVFLTGPAAIGNVVEGNLIGTDVTGTRAIGNDQGVVIGFGGGNVIGGTTPAARNVISGNAEGVHLFGTASTNSITGNFIGTDVSGTTALANTFAGVAVDPSVIGNELSGNTIAYNGGPGVTVYDGASAIGIQGNSIFSNSGLGIDLGGDGVTPNDPGDTDTGANDLQNFPVLSSAKGGSTLAVTGTLNSLSSATTGGPFTVDFYWSGSCDPSGFGEGRTLLGSTPVTTDAAGNASFAKTFGSLVPGGSAITATATDNAGNTSEFSKCIPVTLPTADLSVTKTDSPDPVAVGADLTYQMTVANAGPDPATGVTLTDALPGGVGFVSATPSQGSCTGTATVTCTLGSMATGSGATVTIVVKPTAAGTITNTVSVSGDVSDPNPANDTAQATTTVSAATADLSLTKSASPDPVTAGGTLTYTIVLKDNGPGAATAVSMQDPLPGATTFQSLTSSAGWSCATPAVGAAGTVACTKSSMAPGEAAEFTIVVKVGQVAGSLTNTATVSSQTTDPTSVNNSAQATTEVASLSADLSVHKTASPHPVGAGKKLTYTITLHDHGPDGAQGVVLVDHLPKRTKFLSISAPPAWTCTTPPTGERGTVRCTGDLLGPGAGSRIVVVVRVGRHAAGATITNTATVSSQTADPSTANNSDSARTRVRKPASRRNDGREGL